MQRRSIHRTRLGLRAVPLLVFPALILDTGCGDDSTGPEIPAVVYDLAQVNGTAIPTTVVQGYCVNPLFFFVAAPDTVEVDGGRLTLRGDGEYELYYTWRGKTDFCTMLGLHWHRIATGAFRSVGTGITFTLSAKEPSYWPTGNRNGSSWEAPSGSRNGAEILVSWGSLRLQFVPRGAGS